MALVTMKELLERAKSNYRGIGAFSVGNMEMVKGAIQAAEELDTPIILQIAEVRLKHSPLALMGPMMVQAAKEAKVDVAVHLDHGLTMETVEKALELGFTSVMFDSSTYPFEENIEEVKRAVEYCHFYNVPVEAELGCLQGKEEDIVNEADAKTDPDMVADFVSQTGCDLLAVAVGNVHGLDIEPKVDLPLLEQISKISPVPLVMHGGSGIPFDIIQKAREFNLLKVNYGSDLRKAFVSTFGQAYEANHNACSVIELSIEAVENVSEKAAELVTIINS